MHQEMFKLQKALKHGAKLTKELNKIMYSLYFHAVKETYFKWA